MRSGPSSSKVAVQAALVAVAAWSAPSSTETAAANGDTRTLHLRHLHTGEVIDATFRVDGAYDPAVLSRLNWFLRDWRNDEPVAMDPRLFDAVWEVYRVAGATGTVAVVSAYRSPRTNAMLRARSVDSGVAEHSQHMLGKAMDTTMPGMSMERVREVGMRLQYGGVGYYQSSNFVHLDVGTVRSWPRMSREVLSRVFPDGKTVHLPTDGRPLARYAEARAEIESRDGGQSPPAIAASPLAPNGIGAAIASLFAGGGGAALGTPPASPRPLEGTLSYAAVEGTPDRAPPLDRAKPAAATAVEPPRRPTSGLAGATPSAWAIRAFPTPRATSSMNGHVTGDGDATASLGPHEGHAGNATEADLAPTTNARPWATTPSPPQASDARDDGASAPGLGFGLPARGRTSYAVPGGGVTGLRAAVRAMSLAGR